MNYAYTEVNRLEQPHAYMYAPYGGADFLRAYAADRQARLRALAPAPLPAGADAERLRRAQTRLAGLLADAARAGCPELAEFAAPAVTDAGEPPAALAGFATERSVATPALLESLLEAWLAGTEPEAAKLWLDRLVQRFEVSKKLFQCYPPGFRKGEGSSTELRNYWLLALCLLLAQQRSGSPKYLSTLLKLVDLLLSLPPALLAAADAAAAVRLLGVAELACVRRLAEDKKVEFDVV